MADPISAMAVTSLIGTAVGGGVSAFGAYQGGQSQKAMFNYQSRVAQINAGIANEQAAADLVAGGRQAEVEGTKVAERVGMTRAGIAAGGFDPGSGSAKNVTASEEEAGQFSQRAIANRAAREAYGSEVAAFGSTAQSNVDVAAGRGAVQAADFNIGTSVLGAATSVADKWVKFGQTTPTPLPFGG